MNSINFAVMDKKRVILSVINNLENDQRVHKVASSLYNNGYDVTVIGSRNTKCSPYHQVYNTQRLNVFFEKGFLFYAEFNIRIFFKLLQSTTDIYVANDTDTLVPNFIVSKIKKKKLVVDLHELFPEVPEVVNRKFVKGFWTKIESLILPRIKNGYTVCQSIADYYKSIYGVNLSVIRNVPYKTEEKGFDNKFNFQNKKVILYQGAVNVGRGIEWIIESMQYIDNAVFVIIGNGDILDDVKQLTKKLNLEDKVIFKGHIPFKELPDYTKSSDLGVCLLENIGLSYYYSLPNRVFDFMQANVPLLATDFPEIANVLEKYETGYVISNYDAKYLSEEITKILNSPKDYASFKKANELFNWENEEKKLLEIYNGSI